MIHLATVFTLFIKARHIFFAFLGCLNRFFANFEFLIHI